MFKKMIMKLWPIILKHKAISLAIFAVMAIGGYFGYQALFGAKTETRYVLAVAEKGTIMSTVSGAGQVSASNQIDLKAKASGDATNVNLKKGQEVKKDDLLVQLNATDVYKTVRDAVANLETARLALEKFKQPADDLTIMQAENSLAQAEDTARKADDNITKAYEDSMNAIANAFLNFPTIIAGLYDIQYGNAIGASEASIGRSQDNNSALYNSLSEQDRDKLIPFQDKAKADYQIARTKYDANFSNYRSINRNAEPAEIETLLTETLNTARAMAQTAKSQSNYLDTWVDLRTAKSWTIFTQVRTYQTNSSSYISQTNGHLSTLLALQTTIKDNRQTKANAESSVLEKTASLQDLRDGVDPLDLRTQELSYQSRVNALADAREKYADYSVRAPIDGIIASVAVELGNSVSAGGDIATIITQQKIANVSFNEVDAAKIKVGQKVTLTFDAVSDLNISGAVIDIDTLGTASQGVVSYNVKIGFDTQDERIKSGMSVSATIITDIKQDIIIVPNSAVKSQGSGNYVLVLQNATAEDASATQGVASAILPEARTVEVGASDDNNSEIITGLNEGEYVVAKTTTVTAVKSSSQAPSIIQSLSPQRTTGTKATGNNSAGTIAIPHD